MPIEFDKKKEKNMIMMVEKSGVDDDNLHLTFNININNVQYGFPCELKENKVVISIPALDDVVMNLEPGEYKATLDINGSDKYFMQPFNETIEIIDVPEMKIDKDSLKEKKLFLKVSELIDNGTIVDDKEKVVEESKPKKEKVVEESKPKKEKKTFNIDNILFNKEKNKENTSVKEENVDNIVSKMFE